MSYSIVKNMNDYCYLKNTITGKVHKAIAIGAADTAEQSERWNCPVANNFYDTAAGRAQTAEVKECWNRNKVDGYWIDGIGRVSEKNGWENLHTSFDKLGREIKVGDVVVYAMRDYTVSELKIEKIGNVVGHERVMHGTDLHTNKKTKNSYPSRCLKVSP
jgi:hypothetical protein